MGPLGHSAAALLAAGAALPGAFLLAARPALRDGLGERLGRSFGDATLRPGALWIHAASVGEVMAASRLLDSLAGEGRRLCASAQTTAGRDVLAARHPALASGLAPLDHPWMVTAALARVAPAALVFVENELWPFWIRAASERGVPVLSVSARLSERSLRRWSRTGRFARGTVERLAAVGARTDADAERFVLLGVPESRVRVTGDLKLEPGDVPPRAAELDALLGDVPYVVAASTHEGEEEAALAALSHAEAAGACAALVLAPRHARRFDAVAALASAAGRPVRRRSAPAGGPLRAGEVLLLDSVGELASLFSSARLAFVGGSLVERGGHNVIEPVQAGCPALLGPHVSNLLHALDLLEPVGAVRRVARGAELGPAFLEALADPAASRARGEAGRVALAPARGATARSVALISEVVGPSGSAP